MGRPKRIYAGETKVLPGMKGAEPEIVEIGQSFKSGSMAIIAMIPILFKKVSYANR